MTFILGKVNWIINYLVFEENILMAEQMSLNLHPILLFLESKNIFVDNNNKTQQLIGSWVSIRVKDIILKEKF